MRTFSPSKPMSKLAALKKQIAALEAQAERIAKEEMSSAIAKVKSIMTDFNITIEHLTQTVSAKRAAKKTSAKAKPKVASKAKYADPKTGKTWSGVGRAPGWIAGAKNRDAFLVDKGTEMSSVVKAPATAKKVAVKPGKASKVVKSAAKKVVGSGKKALKPESAQMAAKAKPASRKAAAKPAAVKKTRAKRVAATPVVASATPAA